MGLIKIAPHMSDNKNIVNSRLNDIGCFFEKIFMQKENGAV